MTSRAARLVLPTAAGVLLGMPACAPRGTGQPAPDPPPATASPAAPGETLPARRVLRSNDAALPRIDVLLVESPGEGWVRVDARHAGARVLAYEVLVDSPAFLDDPGAEPVVRRYILYPPGGPPREIVDARDGAPMLPAAVPRDWLPRARAAGAGLAFLGREFTPATDGEPASSGPWPRETVERHVLDSRCLVATSRPFRDDGTGRHGKDYRWTPLTSRDYARMIDAGFNCFSASGQDLVQLARAPVFLVARDGWNLVPDLPLRGSFLGAVMYSDEPAIKVMGGWGFRPADGPESVARSVARETRELLSGDGIYGRGFLRKQLADAGARYGDVVEPAYPVWEAIASAAWYELEAGADGFCYQARLSPARFTADVQRTTGVAFPEDARACVTLCVAVLRGAARRFERPWGVSVYGQMDADAADVLFPAAWDAGATYFWTWTSDGDHHVPWERQLELVRALRDHAAGHPREDPAQVTAGAASTALVLPWGWSLDDYTFGRWSDVPSLWNVPALKLQRKGDGGAEYRAVLASAMREAVELLRSEEPFDVLFLRDGEHPDDRYTRVVRVSAGDVVERGHR